jgi:hypothetical protein
MLPIPIDSLGRRYLQQMICSIDSQLALIAVEREETVQLPRNVMQFFSEVPSLCSECS